MKQPLQAKGERPARIRAFIAVNVPVATLQKVGELQADLRDRARQAGLTVGWVPLSGMHVTLKFLAEIPQESVWAVRDVLRNRLAARSGFWLHVKGTGAFPSRQQPRVLWVGLEDGDQLVQLASDVDRWLEELGFEREKRAFQPHLTLGRVKAGTADILDGLEAVDFGECSVHEVVLYQSVLRRQGAEYTPLNTTPLLKPPPRAAAVQSAPPAAPPAAEEPTSEPEEN